MTNGGRTAKLLGSALAALVLLAILLPAVAGRPLISYASSGSMEPTIGTFDVFFVNPWPGRLSHGDIIVFDSVERGEPAVHRIVGGDSGGWYTQGDANPNPDQMGAEPIVTPDRILGRVITGPSGAPLLLPDMGLSLVALKTEHAKLEQKAGGAPFLQAGFFALLALLFALPLLVGGKPVPEPPARGSPRLRRLLRRLAPRGILGSHVALGLALAILGAGLWAGHQAHTEVTTTLIVVQDPAAGDTIRAAAPGNSLSREVRLGSLGLLPTLALVEPASERMSADGEPVRIGAWATTSVRIEQTAGESIGVQEDSVVVWRYPRLMPDSLTLALHAKMAGAPYLALAAAFAAASWWSIRLMGLARMPVGRWLGLREGWL